MDNVRMNGIVTYKPISKFVDGIFEYATFGLAVGGTLEEPVAVSKIYCYDAEMCDDLVRGSVVIVKGIAYNEAFDLKAVSIIVAMPIG